ERTAFRSAELLEELEVRKPTGRIDRHMHLLPTDRTAPAQAWCEPLMTAAAAAPQSARALGVDLDHLARLIRSEDAAVWARFRKELTQPVRTEAAQDAVRRASREPAHRPDAIGTPAPLHASCKQRGLALSWCASRGAVRSTRSILELAEPTSPSIDRVAAHAEVARSLRDTEALGLSQQRNPGQRRGASGTVHSGPPTFVWC